MVRLKEGLELTAYVDPGRFQFLNGAIKSDHCLIGKLPVFQFQFLNGAIKRIDLVNNIPQAYQISIPQWCD